MVNKKNNKKVEVVFDKGKSNTSNLKEDKVIDHKHIDHKNVTHSTHKEHDHKSVEPKHTSKKSFFKKDYLIIGILVVLILAIVIISFVVPQKDKDSKNIDTNISIDIIDDNQNNLSEITEKDIKEFENKSLELNLKILTDMREYQKEKLYNFLEELEINKEEMDSCLLNNNYLLQDFNMLELAKIKDIQNDSLLSEKLFIMATPTIFVNGYILSGYKDQNQFTNFIYSVKDTENLSLNFSNKSFVVDDNSLKLYVVYDTENQIIDDANKKFITYLQESEDLIPEVKDIFKNVFLQSDVEYIQYNSEVGKNILETIDSEILPAYYLTGDITNLDINKEIFNMIFETEQTNKGYKINPLVFAQLYSANPIDGVYKIIDYQTIVNDSYFLGSKDSKTSIILFTDYDCPYCKKFEEETLTKEFYENEILNGDVKLYIKPLLTNDVFSLFPVLFFKCSQEQDVSFNVHKKIFNLNSEIGVQPSYDVISLLYQKEISDLEAEYARIMEYMQRNYQ